MKNKYFTMHVDAVDGLNFAILLDAGDGVSRWIPTDPANTDYAAYLEWLEEGNVAEEWTGE